MILRYLTHPQVDIDPLVPVPSWGLSDVGRGRLAALGRPAWLAATRRIISSDEVKALETAAILARALDVETESRPAMGENDRSATGYLAAAEFEAVANDFFAAPDTSVRGWERAVDAQARIVSAVAAVVDDHTGEGDLLFVGHGGVGTLLYCHYAGVTIDRRHDQPDGGGHVFAVDMKRRAVMYSWRSMESL